MHPLTMRGSLMNILRRTTRFPRWAAALLCAAAFAFPAAAQSNKGTIVGTVTDPPIPQRNCTLLATLSPGVTRPFVTTLGGGGGFESGGSPGGVIGSGGS